MLSIKECRELLKEDAEGLTDAEVIEIRDWLSSMADLAIESIEKIELKQKTEDNGIEKESDPLHKGVNG